MSSIGLVPFVAVQSCFASATSLQRARPRARARERALSPARRWLLNSRLRMSPRSSPETSPLLRPTARESQSGPWSSDAARWLLEAGGAEQDGTDEQGQQRRLKGFLAYSIASEVSCLEACSGLPEAATLLQTRSGPLDALQADPAARHQIFVICSLTLFLPVALETFARARGRLAPQYTVPCPSSTEGRNDDELRCAVRILGHYLDTGELLERVECRRRTI